MTMRSTIRATLCASALLAAAGLATAQERSTANGEWPSYGGNLSHDRYSPLDQIDADNFSDLELVWQFNTDNLGPRPETNYQSTPLMVNGILYVTAGSRRAAVALDPETGELLWMHRIDEGERGEEAPRRLSGRGLAYWDDGADGVILYVTPGYQLVAVNARTGYEMEEFGNGGIVDLKQNIDQNLEPTSEIGLHSAPIVAGDTILIGAAHRPGGAPPSRTNVKGYVRGFNARTGERKWIFHTIPGGDEYGIDTWGGDSWRYTGNTGVWGQWTVDPELNMAYFPVEAPTGDYYGGHRPGDNLFSGSVVAVDLDTGEREWHYQTVHHDIWDWDLPSAPVLLDITVEGREIKALVLPTKQSYMFVLDRLTGEPVWPIAEIPVRQGDVPGEWYSPTQPIPTKPPAVDEVDLSIDHLVDYTPELLTRAREIYNKYTIGWLYDPPTVAEPGMLGTLQLPSSTGGVNWPGGSADPETGFFYIYTKTQIGALGLVNNPERSDMDFIRGRPEGVSFRDASTSIDGFPMIKPPWGRITAINMNTGDIAWQIPHGEAPDNIRNHPLLDGMDIGRTGWPGRVGVLVTKNLIVAGESSNYTTEVGEVGSMLRAYDKATGEEVGAVFMTAPQSGSPMTYEVNDQQYIVLATSGGGQSGTLLAYRLP
ncbi:MAG: PQQ-binding-like beta-propeller repeat protein [Acidobacteriota bacterium]|nr:PQQ-binding-like beta-propeller repeat protein [Acidobacteriota bacterium]